jgi:apolipoprotein N-acyltransferase
MIAPIGVEFGYGLILASITMVIQLLVEAPQSSKQQRIIPTTFALIWIALIFFNLAQRIFFGAHHNQTPLQIAIVQHQLDIPEKSNSQVEEHLLKLAQNSSAANPKPDLVIFPLFTLPADMNHERVLPAFLKKLAQTANTHILIATRTHYSIQPQISRTGATNRAFLVNPSGTIMDDYQTVETTPLHDSKLQLAPHYRVMQSPWGPLGVFICYESTNQKWVREAVDQDAKILIGLQNLLRFKSTHLPEYSLREDKMNAIFSGKTFLRASTGGLSAAITPHGKVESKTTVGKDEIIFAEVKI